MADENGGGVVEGAEQELDIDQILAENQKLKSKVNEFRNTNISLKKQMEEFSSKIPEFESMRESLEEKERELLKAKGKTEEALQSQIEQMRKKFEDEKNSWESRQRQIEEQARAYEDRYKNLQMDQRNGEVALKSGVQKGALPYVLNDIRQFFEMDDDGKMVPREENRFDTSTGKEWTLETWIEKYRDEKPFLFEGSTGSGAVGGRSASRTPRRITRQQFQREAGRDPEMLKGIAEGKILVDD
ncbi:MAG: hypothetical protein PHW66_09975 [Gallionella sp.]|nr:hypothetical protein [Gallionella sp.]